MDGVVSSLVHNVLIVSSTIEEYHISIRNHSCKVGQMPQFDVQSLLRVISVIEQLHSRSRQYELNSLLTSPVLQVISEYVGPLTAIAIYEVIQRNLAERNVNIASVRIRNVYPFSNHEPSWPMLEWTDNRGDEGLAIFAVEGCYGQRCSYIMHHGKHSSEEDSWSGSTFSWAVTDFRIMKLLLLVAQHALGLLNLPKEMARRLYCHVIDDVPCAGEKYVALIQSDLVVQKRTRRSFVTTLSDWND